MLANHRTLLPLATLLLASACVGDLGAPRPAAEVTAAGGPVRTILQPTAGYRADQVITVDGERFAGRVYAMPGVTRLELPTESEDVVSVLRDGDANVITWVEGSTTVVQTPAGHVGIDLRSPNVVALDLQPLGPDTVDGILADRYAYHATLVGGGTQEGVFWLAPENIVVRLEGTLTRPDLSQPRRADLRLENLQVGPQDLALFEPPGVLVDVTPTLFEEFTRPAQELFIPPPGG